MEGENGALNGFESFEVCSPFALGGLAVVVFKEDVGLFVDVCVTRVESSKAADIIDNAVKKVGFKSA